MVGVWLPPLITVLLSLALETAGQEGERLPSVPNTLTQNLLAQIAPPQEGLPSHCEPVLSSAASAVCGDLCVP